jgi:hypothetical protein
MGSCVFVASGLNFDVDSYLPGQPFQVTGIFRKGGLPPRPDSGFISTAVLFRNFGKIEGVLASLKCRVKYLKHDWWQKALRLRKRADHGIRWKAQPQGTGTGAVSVGGGDAQDGRRAADSGGGPRWRQTR